MNTHIQTHMYLDIDLTKAKSLVWPVVSMHLHMQSLQDFEVWPVHSDAWAQAAAHWYRNHVW